MKTVTKYSRILALLAVVICTGCASKYDSMVRFAPSENYDPRTETQLFRDVNSIMPFHVSRGDFVVNKGMQGPSCWVSFGDTKRTRILLAVLDADPEWKVTQMGSVLRSGRSHFGLHPEPGEYSETPIDQMLAMRR